MEQAGRHGLRVSELALRPYRGRASNVFGTIAGIVAVGGILVGLLR